METEHPEKTHDFRQSVDRLFSHESVARIEPTYSELGERHALALTLRHRVRLLWQYIRLAN
jgi:hypothetical protein